MSRRRDENPGHRAARLVELGNLCDVGGANRSDCAHSQCLGERRVDPGERGESAGNFDARGAGLRVEAAGRFDRAAYARDLVAPNRFVDQGMQNSSGSRGTYLQAEPRSSCFMELASTQDAKHGRITPWNNV